MQYVPVKNASKVLGVSQRHLRRQCASGAIAGSVKLGGSWHLPHTYDNRLLALVTGRSRKENIAELDKYAKPKRDAALRKLGAVREFEDFSALWVRGGGLRTEALAAFCEQLQIGQSTLKRWLKEWKDAGIDGLVDMRGGEVATNGFTAAAAEMFKSLYLDQRRPSVRTCLMAVGYYNKQHNLGWVIPSLRSAQKWVASQLPEGAKVLHREGLAAYEAKCAPYIQSDPDSYQPGECWVGDHHQFNFWARHKGKWVRPWLTMWMDYRSRKMVGWQITNSPNQTTIMQAFAAGAKVCGLPGKVKIDNGKDYASQMFIGQTKKQRRQKIEIDEQLITGLYAMLDVGVSFSLPYHPQSKPVERLFATVDTQFAAGIETYCGKDSARKPDYLNDRLASERAIGRGLDFEQVHKTFAEYADIYNNSIHTGDGMNATPNQVFSRRESERVIDPAALELFMQVWSGELTIGKNGVRFGNLLYGQYDPAILAHQGKRVRLSYNPDDISRVSVYDAATMRLLAVATQNELIKLADPASETAMREAQANKARAKRIVRDYKPASVVAAAELPELIRAAQADAAKGSGEPPRPNSLQLVRTVLDGQGEVVSQAHRLKLAAGLENAGGLDLDFENVRKKEKVQDLGLL